MIVFDESIRAVWFMQVKPDQDFMLGANENPDGTFLIQYRHRYYHSLAPFDPKDRSNWYEAVSRQPLDTTIANLQKFTRTLGDLCGAIERKQFFELVRGAMSLELFVEQYARQPFVHQRRGTPEDEAAYQKDIAERARRHASRNT